MELDIQSIILAQGAKFNAGLFILMLVMIVLSAFFSMSETAFSSTSQVKLKVEVENRKKGAKKALQLSENFEKVLTTLLIGNNLVNTKQIIIIIKKVNIIRPNLFNMYLNIDIMKISFLYNVQ